MCGVYVHVCVCVVCVEFFLLKLYAVEKRWHRKNLNCILITNKWINHKQILTQSLHILTFNSFSLHLNYYKHPKLYKLTNQNLPIKSTSHVLWILFRCKTGSKISSAIGRLIARERFYANTKIYRKIKTFSFVNLIFFFYLNQTHHKTLKINLRVFLNST